MSNLLIFLISSVLLLLIFVTNIYWYRREGLVRKSIQMSKYWDDRNPLYETTPDRRIKEIAEKLDIRVDEVPQAVDSLQNKIQSLQRSLDSSRESWAASTRDALKNHGSVSPTQPLIIELQQGCMDDAQALAKVINRDGLTLIFAHQDYSFVVKAGEESPKSAVGIAKMSMEEASGGAGGTDRLAQGGGQDPSVFERVKSTVQDQASSRVFVVNLG